MKSQLSYDVAIRMSYRISLTHFAQHDIPIVSSTQFCYLDILVTVFSDYVILAAAALVIT